MPWPRLKICGRAADRREDAIDAPVQRRAAGHERQRVEIALGGEGFRQRRAERRAGSRVQSRREPVADAGRGEALQDARRRRARRRSFWRSRPRRLAAPSTMRRIGSSESGSNSAGGKADPKLSKICTASAPASTWRIEIGGRGHHQPVDQRLHEGRIAIGGEAGRRLVGRALAGDHVAGDGPGRAAEAQQRRLAAAATERRRSSVSKTGVEALERQLVGKPARDRLADVTGSSLGPSFSTKRTSWPSACGIDQDIGEHDRGVEPEAADRLQRHLVGKTRRVAEIEERARLFRGSPGIPADSGPPGA